MNKIHKLKQFKHALLGIDKLTQVP